MSLGLMADKFGSYNAAFYMSGSVVMLAAVIPFILFFTKREGNVHEDEKGQELHHKPSKGLIIETNSQSDNVLCCDNMAADFIVKEANLESPFNVTTVAVLELSCTNAIHCSGNKVVKDENDAHSPLDDNSKTSQSIDRGVVNESFTLSDVAISNNGKTRETDFHFTTAEVEVEVNSPLSSSAMKVNEHDRDQDLASNTRM